MPLEPAGYSGTPLWKKLGIVEGSKVYTVNAPTDYVEWLAPLPSDVTFEKRLTKQTDLAHVFCEAREKLEEILLRLLNAIKRDGVIWVSWPKKASKVPTDITEDTIREIALPLGLVDIKVCAVSEVWSGLKLMIRKELR